MGDGGTPVVCHGQGIRYRAPVSLADSPDCGYPCTHPSTSRPGHRYAVTATSTFNGAIIQTGTESYRLAHTRALAEQAATG